MKMKKEMMPSANAALNIACAVLEADALKCRLHYWLSRIPLVSSQTHFLAQHATQER